MKHFKYLAFLSVVFLASWGAQAFDNGMVNGAQPLSPGVQAFSIDLGLDIPEPLLYGVRFDSAIGSRVQLGVGGTSLVALNSLGIYSLFNLYRSNNERDFFSFYLNPSLLHLMDGAILLEDENPQDDLFIFLIQPGIAYEHRFGEEKNTGVYFKVGSIHVAGVGRSSGKTVGGLAAETTVLQATPGFQHQFKSNWSIGLSGTLNMLLANKASNTNFFQGLGKLSITKAF